MLAAAEHEVFEQVRESGFPGALILRPNVIPDVHRYDGRFVVFMDDQGETVPQNKLLERNIDILGENRQGKQQRYSQDMQTATHRTSIRKM
jgi:regulator of sirC expression with transglutaminase-like and TPR domain